MSVLYEPKMMSCDYLEKRIRENILTSQAHFNKQFIYFFHEPMLKHMKFEYSKNL